MTNARDRFDRAALLFTCLAAVAVLVSVSASQIFIGAAILSLLLSRRPVEYSRAAIPAAVFVVLTLVSLAFSGDISAGFPYIKKFFVWTMLILAYTCVRSARHVRYVVIASIALMGVSSALGVAQFAGKYMQAEETGQNFYQLYVGRRITGFMSHWMTFGGEQMIVLMMALAFLFFARPRRRVLAGVAAACALIGVALLLGFTRGVWLGVIAGGVYLVWQWRRLAILLIPVAIGLAFLFAPVRERIGSLTRPHGDRDSNEFRIVVWRVGMAMAEKHPLLGVGPGQVPPLVRAYLPPDLRGKPLPDGFYGHLHSIYFHYAAERGIPATLALMWFFAVALLDYRRALKRPDLPAEVRFVLHGCIAAIVSVLVEGIFELNMGDSEVLTLTLAVMSFGYVAIRELGAPQSSTTASIVRGAFPSSLLLTKM